MRRLRYAASAEDDLDSIASHILERTSDAEAAIAFDEKLRDRCRTLAGIPGTLGTARPELRQDLRSTPFGNYVIFFRYNGDAIEIISVLVGARDLDARFGGRN
ncbi:type II toxin-antitoxin system RelE/ParE family toxin [Sphingomonas sp. M1-B02]|uniref:type II toxin-antitoxin system RelE/ParE family toxin n=1 Tax=Sphingomonas sp. M1-B02 TaxID=3114300 RepID=UPI002240CCFB|nr:type II toxin-antitoxin system RelE/ParE family toxin [Sphingomonas sp. S6-11]UZK65656.1 type II toxin-antitoxin system RelE/ParE family toxin [Sphingomonas sp. S6-11]